MKTIISLVIAALIVNACIRAGDSAWRYYQFEDAVSQETRFGNAKTTSELRRRLLQMAIEHDVAVAEEDVVVERRGIESFVSMRWVEALPLVPKVYTHEQAYDITLSVQPVRPLADDKKK